MEKFMPNAQIIMDAYEQGIHNRDGKSKQYKDASTVCLIPTRGKIPWRVVQSWWNMMTPMNQQFFRMGMVGMEVGHAYSTAIDQIIHEPNLRNWKYILTLEEDNIPPPDGLLKLIRVLEELPDIAAVGGLYWTKGEAGQPMIYGNPADVPLNFRPIPPDPGGNVIECNGLGMGFTLFRMDLFKDERIQRPWFQTVQKYDPAAGSSAFTQDLYFFQNAKKYGYRFAVDCSVRVGHYDYENDIVW
jgi:hypothetical protein